MRRHLLAFVVLLALATTANTQEMACADLVNRALTEMGEHCGDLERNSLCYGHPLIEASFATDSSADFNQPDDRVSLGSLKSVKSTGIDLDTGQWGVAVMNLGAHLPAAHAGPGAILLLVGDAELTHEVELSQIAEIGEPLRTATLGPTTLYAHPSIIAVVADQLEPETIVLVDAISGDGNWLRAVNNGGVSWAESDNLARLGAMDGLPEIDIGDAFALRYFTFESSTELPDCTEGEPTLVIQTPAELPAGLRVNGAEIRVNALVSFQQLHSNALGMTVHRGEVTTASGETIAEGNSVIGILGGSAILAWSGALTASETELARGERAQIALNRLARSNGWDEFGTEMRAGAIIHTVAYGDTLYALARIYDVPLDEIIAANTQSTALRLLVGEELLIPNPGSGFSGSSPVVTRSEPSPAQTQPTGPDCSGLRLTAPLDAATGLPSPYYWDGIPAATGYRINVFDHGSATQVGSFHTGANQTTVSISAGQLGIGGALQWEVIALVDGQSLCSTGLSAPLPHVSP